MELLADTFDEVFRDPITTEYMEKAVITPYGHSFSESSITEWFSKNQSCPLTHQTLRVADLRPNYSLRSAIHIYIKHQQKMKDQCLPEVIEQLGFLKSRMIELSIEFDCLQCQSQDLQNKLGSVPTTIKSQESERESLNGQVQNFEKEISQLKEQVEANKLRRRQCDHNNMNLHLQEEALRAQKSELVHKQNRRVLGLGKGHLAEIDSVDRQLRDVLAKKEATSAELIKASEQKKKLSEDISQIQNHVKTIKLQIQKLSSELQILHNEYDPLISAQKKCKSSLPEVQESHDTLLRQLVDLSEKSCAVASEVHSMKGSQERMTKCQQASHYKELGNNAFRLKQYRQSIDFYSRAINSLGPYFSGALYLNRAAAYQQSHQFLDSIKDCQHVINETTLQNLKAKAHRRMATAYIYANEFVKAMREISEALNINESDAEAQKLMKFVTEKQAGRSL